MAEIGPISEIFRRQLAKKPDAIQTLAERLPINRLYRHMPTGYRVTIFRYDGEPEGHVSVEISGTYNLVEYTRLQDVRPEDLTECDLPAADEDVGAALTRAQVPDFLAWKAQQPDGVRACAADYLMQHVRRGRTKKG